MFTVKKIHINEKGEAKSCRAYIKGCPITAKTNDPHFETQQEAQWFYEMKQIEMHNSFNTVSKKSAVSESEPKIKQSETGQYFTTVHKWEEENIYLFGNLTTDINDVQALHKSDPEKEYQDGSCGVIANELWNTNPHVEDYYILSTKEEPEIGIHQFVKLKDGTYADSQGIWSEKEFIDCWKDINPTVKLQAGGETDENGNVLKPDPSSIDKPENQELYNTLTEIINKRFKNK